MRLGLAAIILSILAALPCHAAESTEVVTADMAILQTLDQQIESAMVRADTAFLQKALADDFRFNHINAHRFQTKAQLIEEFGKPGAFLSRTVDSVTIEPHGEAASKVGITTGRIHFKTPDGNEQTLWYVRVYAQRAGAWQLLSHITTAKAKGPLPVAK
ncbi:MAG: nuclear transport factor 2 family protein [Acidobacteria bacterium]|nr:nuclear transport factor 2 family protein [Acidobacteriota bacterium]